MKLELGRTVETEVGLDELPERLERWAELTAYKPVSIGPRRWLFRRGRWWHSLYSFNIRKWPTRAVVEIEGERPARVHCSIRFKSWWAVALAEDEQRLLEDLELLLAFVCERSAWRFDMVPTDETR